MQQMFKAGAETLQTVTRAGHQPQDHRGAGGPHRQGSGDGQGAGPRADLRRAGGLDPAQRDPDPHPVAAGPGRAGRSRGRRAALAGQRQVGPRAARRDGHDRPDRGASSSRATTCSRRCSTTRSTRPSPTISARWPTTSATSPSGWPRARGCWASSPGTAAPRARSGPLGDATADFRVAMANLRAVTDRLKEGEGTLGALLEDPTVYENLVQFLEGSRRSFLLRTLIRSTIDSGASRQRGRKRGPLMARERTTYRCQECGLAAAKPGTCPDCARAGTYVQLVEERVAPARGAARPGVTSSRPQPIRDISVGDGGHRVVERHGGARPRAGGRGGERVAGPDRRGPGHRQVHAPPPGRAGCSPSGRGRCCTSRARSRPAR